MVGGRTNPYGIHKLECIGIQPLIVKSWLEIMLKVEF